MPLVSLPGAKLIHRATRDLFESPELQSQAQQALRNALNTTVLMTTMDLSVEAEAFGANVRREEDEVPTITGRLVISRDEICNLGVPVIGGGRTGIYLETARKLSATRIVRSSCRAISIRPASSAVEHRRTFGMPQEN